MIQCSKRHLEQRCRQRGYTLDEVMPCVVAQDGDAWTVDTSSPHYPRTARTPVRDSAPPPGGPGWELKVLLRRWLGIVASPTCSCNAHAAQMDAWGPDECESRVDEIVGWLREEAARRRLPFLDAAARQLVLLAVRRARNAAAG